MKFECKEISINDEEFGCTISFSENVGHREFESEQSVEEIINSLGQYVMLQRTYPEDQFEQDYYYFESSDFDKSGGMNEFEIKLCRNRFILNFENEVYDIQINPDNRLYEKIKKALEIITANKGKINIQE